MFWDGEGALVQRLASVAAFLAAAMIGLSLAAAAAGAVAMMPAASLRAARSARTRARRASGFRPLRDGVGRVDGHAEPGGLRANLRHLGGLGANGICGHGGGDGRCRVHRWFGCDWCGRNRWHCCGRGGNWRRVRGVGGRGGHLWTLSAGGGCAAGCGGEGVESGDGIGEIVGQTGGDGVGPAEHGGFGGQRRHGSADPRDRRRRFRRRGSAPPPARAASGRAPLRAGG